MSSAEGGNIAWYLEGEPLIAFQIHEGDLNKKRLKKLFKGHAILRWVIAVNDKGYVRFLPQRTRKS